LAGYGGGSTRALLDVREPAAHDVRRGTVAGGEGGGLSERVHALLNRKYGLMKRIGSWFSRLRGKQHDMIAISPAT